MIPKVRAALDAASALPSSRVKIVPGGRDAVRRGLKEEIGTLVLPPEVTDASVAGVGEAAAT